MKKQYTELSNKTDVIEQKVDAVKQKVDVTEQKVDVIEQKVDQLITLLKTNAQPQEQPILQPEPPPQVIRQDGHEIHAQPAIKQSNQCKKCHTINKVLIITSIVALTAIVFKLVIDLNIYKQKVEETIYFAALTCGNDVERNYLMYSLCMDRYDNDTQQQYFSLANNEKNQVKTA